MGRLALVLGVRTRPPIATWVHKGSLQFFSQNHLGINFLRLFGIPNFNLAAIEMLNWHSCHKQASALETDHKNSSKVSQQAFHRTTLEKTSVSFHFPQRNTFQKFPEQMVCPSETQNRTHKCTISAAEEDKISEHTAESRSPLDKPKRGQLASANQLFHPCINEASL